ncbi:DUF4326 domain-containing protein [Streptosporangium carneum]|uniref:DUF4326 domain-containing protein n=1 Tax=Streptosporangium carneum TaxID=47481 RepID=A0A9W6I446_9ACTN|nr:DUF4326 domain-containing protein [Streptosporangium carneum]GLK11701.1 hypothetical protein GCM10017600_51080 [Streptosporangium carneum]
MPKRVQYKRGQPKPQGVVVVTRVSRWGNPFTVAEHGRAEAMRLHREHLLAGTLVNRFGHRVTVDMVRRELRGFDLGCACDLGELCHADTLLRVANSTDPVTEISFR